MHYLVCFSLDFSIPPRSGGLRITIFVFRGPIWMRFKNIPVVFRWSRCRGPKKHVCKRRICCHGLLQAPPQLCSWLVVEGVLHVIRTRYLDNRTCSWTTRYVLFFFRLVLPKQTLEDCLLLLAAAVFLPFRYFWRFFLRQSV